MSDLWLTGDESDKNTFTKQEEERRHIFRLRRDELEQRFLHLRDDMLALKAHSRKQEEKLKKMASKLVHLIGEKKRVGRRNDKETEELIAKMQKRIRDLYRENVELKSKLCRTDPKYILTKKQVSAKRVDQSTVSTDGKQDFTKVLLQLMYWLGFLLAFLVIYKFFMSSVCNYLLDYYFREFVN